MNAYKITYKASRLARLKQTGIRFAPDREAACIQSKRALTETFPKVVILAVEPVDDPRKERATQ